MESFFYRIGWKGVLGRYIQTGIFFSKILGVFFIGMDISQKSFYMPLDGGPKAIWNFSENKSVVVAPPVP